ncbi:hypothetical protein CO659_31050 [Rhizobium sp. S9]|nr:hypothetical protein CO659_31050 [Rhizobium sp. S9]
MRVREERGAAPAPVGPRQRADTVKRPPYPTLGYVEFGRIGGRDEGRPVDRIWFRKELSAAARLGAAGGGLPRVRRRNHP